ncbi:MAG: sterol desaturase family protein [Cytophagales bacterium]|nr:sterol desaturase family protein [Cytophagales bacterium]
MMIALNIFIIIASFLFMEGVAWFTHKYIMHGFMWRWHRSHHTVHGRFFERNDLFAVVFSIPSIVLIALGVANESLGILKYFGFGIMAYGIFYSIFHDVIVHRRIKIRYKAKSPYMKRIINAHYHHHRKHTKEGGEAFGFLYAPKKYEVKSAKAE